MMKFFPIFILLISVYGCKASMDKKLSKSDIIITCPDNWEISDVKNYSQGKYIAIEKKGLNASGLITLTSIPYDANYDDLEKVSDDYIENFSSNFILKNANIQFDEPIEGTYNSIPSLHTHYTMSIFKIPHQGEIIAFHHKGRTVVITKQGAEEDKEYNKEGFKSIEKSFKIKEGF